MAYGLGMKFAIGCIIVLAVLIVEEILRFRRRHSRPPICNSSTILALLLCIGSVGLVGCSTDATTTAVNSDAVVITGVNAAMTTWASYVNSGKATIAQVNSVSNAYALYYQSQIIASNLATAYVENPTTNLAGAEQNALVAALQSQTNIVAIINQLVK